MRFFISLAVWAVCIYTAYCGIVFMLQRQILFPRHLAPPQEAPIPYRSMETPPPETIWLGSDAHPVECRLFQPDPETLNNPSPVIIFAHGNAEVIDYLEEEFHFFIRWGMALMLVEYPGYGRSGGQPSEDSITSILTEAYDRLADRVDIDPSRIVLMGRSLGGGAICQLAARRPSAGLILISTFTSARSFSSRYLVPGFLVRDPFDSLPIVASYPGPVLIIHGQMDDIIPFRHAQALAKAAPRARLTSYLCGHNDLPPSPDIFRQDLLNFLYDNSLIDKPEPSYPLI